MPSRGSIPRDTDPQVDRKYRSLYNRLIMNTTVFVDLEDTLVDSFDEMVAVNHEKVDRFMKEHCPNREVDLFSFAVWDERELERMHRFAFHVEREHDLKFNKIWTCMEMIKTVQAHTGVFWDLHDFLSVWGKERGFEDFCTALRLKDHTFVLFDDVVPNKIVHFSDTNVTIKFVKCQEIS